MARIIWVTQCEYIVSKVGTAENCIQSTPPDCRFSSYSFPLLAYFPYFKKIKISLRDLLVVCLWISPHSLFNAWTNLYQTWCLYHGTSAHLNGVLHKPLPSIWVSMSVFLLSLLGKGSVEMYAFVARQRLCQHEPEAMNTCNNKRIVGSVCLWVCLCIPLSLLGNNSVKTLPRQRRIFGGVVFYTVRVVFISIRSRQSAK
jgi:hypothetical protein